MSSSHLLRLFYLPVALLLTPPLSAGASGAEWHYGVKAGDTLIGIAAAYLENPNDWPKLQALNKVLNPKWLKPGSKLRLPVALLKREAAVAQVIYVQGKATRTPNNGPSQILPVDARLQVGDVIETANDSSVSLRFVDGSRLLLTPNTRITLAEMVLFGKTGMAQTVLELHRGSIDSRVAKQVKPAARYEIKTRPLNLAVRGTDFRASVDDANQASRGEVLEGLVQASGARGKMVAVQSGFGTLAVQGEPPRAPLALPPAPDLSRVPGLIERLPLRFTFPAYPGIERYRAQVFADRTFDRLLLDGVFNDNTAKWVDMPDGRYVLRVRGIEQNGLEGLNADREFVLKARPEPPFISAPLDGQKSYGPEAMLRWSASMSAQNYHVQVSATPDFSALLADVSGLAKTEHAVSLAPGQYYWRIASVAAGQDRGPFSDVQGFTQRKIPDSPKMEAPQISDKGMVFSWVAGEPGSQYQLQVARDPEFSQTLLDKLLTGNQAQIDRPEPGTYYLRMKTIDADGFAGPFGPAQKVEIPESKWWMLLLLAPLIPLGL
ncbi:MAG TPA: FecR domain-containing protein [Thiobacillus sp.]|nr:FecR domain-containing protein [Thiobacillus sp.]